MRSLAFLAVFAAFGQHLLELGHALTVEHARCPEHGELLHVGADPTQAPVPAQVRPSPPTREKGHDHCAVDWLARFQIGTADPALETVRPDWAQAQRLSPAVAAAARAILRLAPKTSPPHLA